MLRVSRVHYPVTVLGPGVRAGIWVQGCSLHCPGCVSRDTWDPTGGGAVAVDEVLDWCRSLPALNGVTISGGEPFDQPDELTRLLTGLRTIFMDRGGDLDLLAFSGYAYRRLAVHHPDALALLDAVVTGPYLKRRARSLPLRGSDNQRLVLLTDRARRRYADLANLSATTPDDTGSRATDDSGRTDKPRIQVDVGPDGEVFLIGIPRPGDLTRLEETLAEQGVTLERKSWA